MFSFFTLLLFILAASKSGEQSLSYDEVTHSNILSCPGEKRCSFVEDCPAIRNLMKRNDLPVHRFRQVVCGYDEARPKVCCNGNDPSYSDVGSIASWRQTSSECGKSLIRSDVETIGSYPFVARVGFINTETNEIKYSCSGVIINERTILTTASCALAKSSNYKLHSVLVGEYNTECDPDCNSLFCAHEAQNLNVAYVVKHPNYRAETFENNIALLRLRTPINYTVAAQPICFIPENRYVSVGSTTVLVGWGKSSDQKVKPIRQQSLKMRVLSKQGCSDYLSQGLTVEICAMGRPEPCSGYSGSPLLYKYEDTYFLVGLLSYGCDCESQRSFPVAFTNVQRYTRWITGNC